MQEFRESRESALIPNSEIEMGSTGDPPIMFGVEDVWGEE